MTKHRAAWTSRFAPQLVSPNARRATVTAGDRMNKTERRFKLEYLQFYIVGGLASRIGVQRLKLRLADRTWYTPDFDLVMADGTTAIFEVKGYWEDDARVKIKVAAELYPHYVFHAAMLVDGAWRVEHISRPQPAKEDPCTVISDTQTSSSSTTTAIR